MSDRHRLTILVSVPWLDATDTTWQAKFKVRSLSEETARACWEAAMRAVSAVLANAPEAEPGA